ncbi:MAG: ferredoxin [Bryobacteraceae bacterium]
MPRIKLEDLARIKERTRQATLLREGAGRVKITVHMGTCGIAAGARTIMSVVLDEVERRDLTDVLVTTSGCAGFCSREPMVTVELAGQAPVKYGELTATKMKEILDSHVVDGRVLEQYVLVMGSERVH